MFDFIEDAEVRAKVEEAHKQILETAVTDAVTKKVDEAVSGMKEKNEALLDEKKKIETMLKSFDGLDAEKAKEALKFLDSNEEARLLKEGKFDELLDKKTSGLKTDFEAQINELNSKLTESTNVAETFKSRYQDKVVEDSIRDAALKANVRPEALQDILTRGGGVFSLGEDGTVEARDKDGKLRKLEADEDIIMTPTNWVESLKEIAPHYWPASEGIDAGGGGSSDDLMKAMNDAAAKGDMAKYRKLREKQKKRGVA